MADILTTGVVPTVGVLFWGVLRIDLALAIVLSFVAFLSRRQLIARRVKHVLPPGPLRLPFIGNLLQIPRVHPWLTYGAWTKLYGDIIYLQVFSQPLVVLNSATVAQDLLDKRSAIYSDRPRLVMAELSGYDQIFSLQPYGNYWKAQRKLVAHGFNQSTVPRYWPTQENEARKLVQDILADPKSVISQMEYRIAAIILEVTYGYSVKGHDDPMIATLHTFMNNFSAATLPGAWLVDLVPHLECLPTWMPGVQFLRTAASWKKLSQKMSWSPYLWCKENVNNSITRMPNFCATTLQSKDGVISSKEEATLVPAAVTVLGGGFHTNLSTICIFILAMLHYPDVQAKAQAEIDTVIGHDRLPDISDKESLPYVRALITEVYRWIPAVPLGLPHGLTEDDVYKGFLFRKGTAVVANVWNMLQDPETFPDPTVFKPERYHGDASEMRKVINLAFGFGRRSCPGLHFAEGTTFAIVATMLATCDIVPAKDAYGKDIIPELKYTSETVIFPENLQCDLKPRSARHKTLLADSIAMS
ncbi:cytochrome P450 [Laetiporus sulphureus 93-53]|uniref:Cytochrome P450 n=1 Tax=Laetiporus sulphureus 93-53 TaxID=1314785 RepID=A0A165HDX2_9APHY|nr:cytochrome P450 [Laetiporus sulphureus 93-53]KZT11606.1 cytochrome P450 [Laetiporus sulphureus 93-53]